MRTRPARTFTCTALVMPQHSPRSIDRRPRPITAVARLLVVLLIGTLSACGGGDGGGIVVPRTQPALTGITVSPTSLALQVSQAGQLQVSLAGPGASSGRGSISFSSSASAVAVVSATGLVTAVGPGTATITVTGTHPTVDNLTAATVSTSAVITVTARPVASLALTLAATALQVGQQTQATAVARDATGATIPQATITLASSVAGVASISQAGLITALAPGTTIISATSEGRSATVPLTVTQVPVNTITIAVPSPVMAVGTTQTPVIVTRDANNNVLTGRNITLSTSNAAIVSVGLSGGSATLTGVSAGQATITATSEGRSATATVVSVLTPTLNSLSPSAIDAVFANVRVELNGANLIGGGLSIAGDAPAGTSIPFVEAPNSTTWIAPLAIATPAVSGVVQLAVRKDTLGTSFQTPFRTTTIYPIATAPLRVSNYLGGEAGGAFGPLACPAGTIATQLNGRGAGAIDQLSLGCQAITGTTRSFGTVQQTGAAGGSGGTPFSLPCGSGQVLVGVTARLGDVLQGYLLAVAAICAPVAGGSNETTNFAGRVDPSGTTSGTVMCPVGLAVTGIEGNTRSLVDRIRLRCQ